jgi:hypothetical protein
MFMADDIDKPTIEDIVLVDMANRGLVRDTGKRKNGLIVWELTDLGHAWGERKWGGCNEQIETTVMTELRSGATLEAVQGT